MCVPLVVGPASSRLITIQTNRLVAIRSDRRVSLVQIWVLLLLIFAAATAADYQGYNHKDYSCAQDNHWHNVSLHPASELSIRLSRWGGHNSLGRVGVVASGGVSTSSCVSVVS